MCDERLCESFESVCVRVCQVGKNVKTNNSGTTFRAFLPPSELAFWLKAYHALHVNNVYWLHVNANWAGVTTVL